MAEDLSSEERIRAREAIEFLSNLRRRGEQRREEQSASGNESSIGEQPASVALASTRGSSSSHPVGVEAAHTLEESADRVLSNLRRMRGEDRSNRERPRKRIAEEMSRLFRQKKSKDCQNQLGRKRTSTWTHHFVCLSQVNLKTIPTTAREKDILFSAGLGERKVVFSNIDCNAEEFREVLLTTFPKLCKGGGYQLCKCRPNSRELEPLSSAAMLSPKNLRDFGGKSRTYIRPLQQDLDLSRTNQLEHDVMMETCLSCGIVMPLEELQDHVDFCKEFFNEEDIDQSPPIGQIKHESNDEYVNLSSDDDVTAERYLARVRARMQGRATGTRNLPVDLGERTPTPPRRNSPTLSGGRTPTPPMYSPVHSPMGEVTLSKFSTQGPTDLQDIIRELQQKYKVDLLDPHEDSRLLLEFRREFILDDALRHASKRKFNPEKTLKVIFIGEEGEDFGGLRREFWRLLSSTAAECYCSGLDQCKTFQQNVPALERNVFKYLGQWTAMSIIQDGVGFPVLTPAVYRYMVSGDITGTAIVDEHIPDAAVKYIITLIRTATDDKSLQEIFADNDTADKLLETGYRKPLISLTLNDRDEIVGVLKLYHTLIKVKAEIDQFVEGLQCLDIDWYIKQYPELMEPVFVNINCKSLTADFIKALLVPMYAEKGTQECREEEATYMHFVDFLDECEEGSIAARLEDVLIFFTGADREPPLGFPKPAQLHFLHEKNHTCATASTCELILRLPTCHSSYDAFREKLILSFTGHGGFGVI